MDKVIRNGQVAVLYSPDFGAGWYTWNSGKKFLVFHPDLVAAVEAGDLDLAAKRAEEINAELYGPDDYIYTGGASDLVIEWLPVGTIFRIHEYDGNESLIIDLEDFLET